MVLRAEVGLYALSVLAASLEDVLACSIGPDEGDSFDQGLVEDEVDGLCCTVDDVYDSIGKPGLLAEFSEDHGGAGVAFGGLENECIACDSGEWNGPQRDHGGEVEGADRCDDTEWFAVRAGLHILCNFDDFAGELGGDAAGCLADLETTENVAFGIGEGLALFKCDRGC